MSAQQPIQVSASRGLAAWLNARQVALAVSSYQSGHLFLIGADGEKVSLHHSNFGYATGLAVDRGDLMLAANGMIWRMADVGPQEGFSSCYMPRSARAINGVDCHEITPDGLFANTAYSCIAAADDRHSFRPFWVPPFISALASEDRCHLNGLWLKDGRGYATAVCKSDIVAGWRDRRQDSGIVMDVPTGHIVLANLSMPHSPRVHDDCLWVLDSGRGNLLCDGERVAFLPGFLRGLAFHGRHAIVGLSLPRTESFAGLPLDDALKERDADPWCGIQVIDTETGHVAEWLRFTAGVRELFDVAVLPGVKRPMAVAPGTPAFASTRTVAHMSNVITLPVAAE